MKVSTVSEMRAMDRTAIEEFGIAEELLMENAGQAVYYVLLTESGIAGRRFLVFCGLGNNGGDGLVVARKILSSGGSVKVFILGDPDKFKGAARLNFDIVSRLPLEVEQLESSTTTLTNGTLETDIADCHIIVDAILGTGITRRVKGLYRDVVEAINDSGKTVFSVDIPSGVHGDTGKVMGAAVQADHTVTFGLPKMGNLLFPGYSLGGELHVSHISFPPSITQADRLKAEINHPMPLPVSRKDAPRGALGRALFVAGAAGQDRAPCLALLSFLETGGGNAHLAGPRSVFSLIANKRPEIVLVPQKETGTGSLALENEGTLLELARQVDIVVLGPGLFLEPEARQLATDLARQIEKPLLIDDDGITALCRDPQILQERTAETVITLDLDAMVEIAKQKTHVVDAQRVAVLQQICESLRATIVLRDHRSLIGYPDRRVFFNMSGTASLATVGSGAVLKGTIAAMCALGLPVGAAVRQAVFVHGLAGDLAASDKENQRHVGDGRHPDKDGITARDILDTLPSAIKIVREGLNEQLMDRYVGVRVV